MPSPPPPPPNERTALNISRSSDAERATEGTAAAYNDSGRTGRSSSRIQDCHYAWTLRLAGATAAGIALLLLISCVTTTSTDGHASVSSSSSDEQLSEAGATQSTESAAWLTGRATIPSMQPFSTTNPADAHCPHMDRPRSTWPTEAWGSLVNASVELHTSLPTSAWWENIVLGSPTQEVQANSLAVIPYTFDVAGEIAGLRIHFPKVSASDLIVQTSFDWRHALQLGCVEDVSPHYVTQPGPLSVTINWDKSAPEARVFPAMSVPAVRGSPYATMEYRDVRPVISARQEVTELKVDGKMLPASSCTNHTSVRVEREVEIIFSGGAVSSDDTWLVFVSEPTEFLCSSWFARERADPPTPGALGVWETMPRFRLEAQSRMKDGVVRAALANDCTHGMSPTACAEPGVVTNRDEYKALLRKHAEVYPTGQARVSYSSSGLNWIVDALQGDTTQSVVAFAVDGDDGGHSASVAARKVAAIIAASQSPADANNQDLAEFYPSPGSSPNASATSNEEGSLTFMWAPRRMDGKVPTDDTDEPELISFALQHHLKGLAETAPSSSLTGVWTPTLHGQAEVVVGSTWKMKVDLSPVSFGVGRPVREEMVDDIHAALDHDVKYEIPANYLKGEGDTYFSGKMLAKMGRIALIAEEMGRPEDAKKVASRLAEASQVWLNGTAGSPLLYDFRWGGVVTCGCAYKKGHGCTNKIGPGECPGLSDPGMNFGLGFYNDHHFHFGYHIFAAAIAAKFDPEWGMKYYEPVTLLIRDIANPSSLDPFFPVFRHKDWFLGSSWALGIPTLGGVPYANGRNQESSSEAVNSYDAVALYGHVMAQVFAQAGDLAKAQTASLIRDTGRQLLATEVKAAQTYWQVKRVGTPGATRVYPEAYRPRVVGMLWSTLAQMQTWFGAEAWKVYGIQMLPITARSEQLLEPMWIEQMLPSFEDSCLYDTNPVKACVLGGWSMLVHVGQAITGRWEEAREGILALPDDIFETAGGNGHSRTSMLWFVANRPESAERKDSKSDANDEDGASVNLSPESPHN